MITKLSNIKILSSILQQTKIYTTIARHSSSQAPQSVLIEKCLEEPVLVVAEEDDVDLIGPPDNISNLRPIIRKRLLKETCLQQKLREMQDATHEWNQFFWAKHNTNFIQKRQEFIDKHLINGNEGKQLTADEMSEFYKSFLDTNWKNHVNYNIEWYKKNFTMLFLSLRVVLEKNLIKLNVQH